MAEEELRELGEHKRLLYVAMTRAADRLVVAGHIGDYRKRDAPDGSWYRLIRSGLEPHAEKVRVEDFGGDILVFGAGHDGCRAGGTWSKRRSRAAARLAAPGLAPEKTGAESFGTLARAAACLCRVDRFHIESFRPWSAARCCIGCWKNYRRSLKLTGLPPRRATSNEPRHDWPDEHAEIAAEALALLADPALQPLLTGQGRSEVPIAGEIARAGRSPVLVSGRIDRLIVSRIGY